MKGIYESKFGISEFLMIINEEFRVNNWRRRVEGSYMGLNDVCGGVGGFELHVHEALVDVWWGTHFDHLRELRATYLRVFQKR